MLLKERKYRLAQLLEPRTVVAHDGSCHRTTDIRNECVTIAVLRLIACSKYLKYSV